MTCDVLNDGRRDVGGVMVRLMEMFRYWSVLAVPDVGEVLQKPCCEGVPSLSNILESTERALHQVDDVWGEAGKF